MMHTYNGLDSLLDLGDKRPFLLTRSTFASTGRFSSYAVRTKYRDWDSLKFAIPSLMNMNMFGIPHTGADVCGAYEKEHNSTIDEEELCLRFL